MLARCDAADMHRRHGSAAFWMGRNSSSQSIFRHATDRPCGRAIRSPHPAFALGCQYGQPYAIFWVDDIDAYDLGEIGPLLESHPVFPDRANISLARVVTREHLMVRTWERGAGLTRACGSAACAALVCASRTGRAERKAIVKLPGGDLAVEWRSDDRVLMTGPVEYEFEGRFDPALFASAEPAR